MQPEIDTERAVGQLADAADHRAEVVGRHVETGEDAEPPGATHFGHELGAGDGAHARLDDRVVDPEEIAQRRAKCHLAPSLAARRCAYSRR